MYEPIIDPITGLAKTDCVRRLSDGAIILFDITREDYRDFLKYEAERNPILAWTPEIPKAEPMRFPDNT
jgi:hypothetical protein